MNWTMTIAFMLLAGAVGGIAAYIIGRRAKTPKKEITPTAGKPQAQADATIQTTTPSSSSLTAVAERESVLELEARAKAKELIIDARDKSIKMLQEAKQKAEQQKEALDKKEKELTIKQTELGVLEKEIKEKHSELGVLKKRLDDKLDKADELLRVRQEKLEKVAVLTQSEAKKELLLAFDKDLVEEKSKRLRQLEEDLKKSSQTLGQEILLDAMRFGATDFVVAFTTYKVKLTDDDMKGRIIGKEGRNIKRFEELTGVDLDLDSAPGEILISSFDSVRREIAKVSLERLILDGRIQPSRIEDIIAETQKEIDHLIQKAGDDLCHKVNVYNIPKELVYMLGKFKYRFSYGQNMIEHTLEETRIGVAIAHELKANVEVVKLGCLFHDIGKIVSDEEGTHVDLGVELLKKFKVAEAVINAVAEHHEDRPFSSIESAIVALADHISGARPGARSEDYSQYAARMKNLEDAALAFDGVDKAYAVSAGREVRIYVKPERVDDESTALLAREIAKKIELEQTYPGVVKVTVIRETRVSETAR